ncbi:hypothetical protein D515_01299 [Grimontia indica]|uniref:Uncharacterized protein n=1 Tax=Grimontia indica TaxID=1056512 RepID=R1IW68_9GAMM|nr:hypothetical protein D515_01299 [Grimontia indica]
MQPNLESLHNFIAMASFHRDGSSSLKFCLNGVFMGFNQEGCTPINQGR